MNFYGIKANLAPVTWANSKEFTENDMKELSEYCGESPFNVTIEGGVDMKIEIEIASDMTKHGTIIHFEVDHAGARHMINALQACLNGEKIYDEEGR